MTKSQDFLASASRIPSAESILSKSKLYPARRNCSASSSVSSLESSTIRICSFGLISEPFEQSAEFLFVSHSSIILNGVSTPREKSGSHLRQKARPPPHGAPWGSYPQLVTGGGVRVKVLLRGSRRKEKRQRTARTPKPSHVTRR